MITKLFVGALGLALLVGVAFGALELKARYFDADKAGKTRRICVEYYTPEGVSEGLAFERCKRYQIVNR